MLVPFQLSTYSIIKHHMDSLWTDVMMWDSPSEALTKTTAAMHYFPLFLASKPYYR